MFNTHRRGIRKVLWRFEKKSVEKHENGSVFSKVGCVNRLLHPNFILGPLLIASEGLTPIVVESIKFCEVSERKQSKNTKMGGELITLGV